MSRRFLGLSRGVGLHWIHENAETRCSVHVGLSPLCDGSRFSINCANRGKALEKELSSWEERWLQPIQKRFALACEEEGIACSFKVTRAAAQVLNNAYYFKTREFSPWKKPLLNQWLRSLKEIDGIGAAQQKIRNEVAAQCGDRIAQSMNEEELLYRAAREKELLPLNFDTFNAILCELDKVYREDQE